MNAKSSTPGSGCLVLVVPTVPLVEGKASQGLGDVPTAGKSSKGGGQASIRGVWGQSSWRANRKHDQRNVVLVE